MGSFIAHLPGKLVSLEGFLTLLILATLMLWRRTSSRLPHIAIAALVALYALASVPLVPYFATRILGRQYVPLVQPDGNQIVAVVVLGAGSRTIHSSEQRLGILSPVGAARVLEAARLYRRLDQKPWVISSGGTAGPNGQSSAATMREALVHLGVRSERIVLESTSGDTHEEAVQVAPILRQLGVERFALVTTRVHMYRAEAAFRAQGLLPIPAIVPDDEVLREWWKYVVPTADGLTDSGGLFHEVVGIAYYRWRGW